MYSRGLIKILSPLCVAFVSIGGLRVESSKDDGWKFRKKILTQQLCGLSWTRQTGSRRIWFSRKEQWVGLGWVWLGTIDIDPL